MVRHRALVVDDIAISRTAAALMLQAMGYEVDEAASGEAALLLFEPAKYAVIIMDYNMPKMNGFECTAKIRMMESESGRRTPIICMSTDNERDMKERCLAAGLDDFLNKDCSMGEMTATVLHWVS